MTTPAHRLCALVVLLVLLPLVARADVAPPEPDAWRPSFTLPVSDGRVEALLVWRDQLVVAGSFTQIGGAYSPGIATWDGTQWHALGGGLRGNANGVHVVALAEYHGDLIAGGIFFQAGDSLVSCIARWDGATWHPMGADLTDGGEMTVRALTVYHDELIAGGYFHHDFGTPSFKHIAAWNGSSWRPLGVSPNNEVSALGVWSDTLVAGGYWSSIGNVDAVRIAAWDGTRWSAMSSGFTYADGFYHGVTDLVPYQGGMVAVGRFDGTGDGRMPHIALYKNGRWSALGDGIGTPEPGDRYPTTIAYRGVVLDGALYASAPPNGSLPRQVSRFDGTSWLSFSNDPAFPISVLAVYHGELIAGGGRIGYRGDDGPPPVRVQDCVARWTGGRWEPLEDGRGLDAAVNALAVFRGDVIAGGPFTEAGPTQLRAIGRWDGARWSPLGDGINGVPLAMTVHGDALVVGGVFSSAGGVSALGVASWDGARWTPLVTTGDAPTVRAVASYGGAVIAAGTFASIDRVFAENVARWNGAWSPLGEGLFGTVRALVVYNGELIAGGDFDLVDGQASGGVAVWRAGRWQPFGPPALRAAGAAPRVTALGVHQRWLVMAEQSTVPGLARDPESESHIWWYSSVDEPWAEAGVARGAAGETAVNALATWQNDLIVGGTFSSIDGAAVSGLAQAPAPQTWAAFNGGVGGIGNEVRALLALDDGHLYAGGAFTRAGAVPSFSLARWGHAADIFPFADDDASPLGLALGSAAPSAGAVTLQYLVHADADVTLAVYDTRGRFVATLVSRRLAAGRYIATWNGRDQHDTAVPSGVYVAQLRAGGAAVSTRIVRVR